MACALCAVLCTAHCTHAIFLIFVVPSIMLYSSEINPTRSNNCVFILRNDFTLHVSGDNLTHHQEYICCISPQVSRLTASVIVVFSDEVVYFCVVLADII